MKSVSGIYAITNTVNGKRYVGSTVNCRRRVQQHFNRLQKHTHPNRHLQAAFDKYGEAVFVPSLVEQVSCDLLLDAEQKHLDANRNGYNIAYCAEAPTQGTHHCDATKAKISNSNKGRSFSPETRAKIRATLQGYRHSPEARARMSAAQKGRVFSLETRAKLSKAKRTCNLSPETRTKLSEAGKWCNLSPEERARRSAVWKLRRHSPETKAKMADARRKYWERIRLERAKEEANK